MSTEDEGRPIESFEDLVKDTFTGDQIQLINLHQFFTDAVAAGFTEDQALSLTAKLLVEVGIATENGEA